MVRTTRRPARIRFWLVLLVILSGAVIAVWGWVPPDVDAVQCRLERNALWASVDWTSKPVDAAAVQQLAATSAARQVAYVLPFTTYLKADGAFSPSYSHAAAFVAQFRHAAPDIQQFAWIGVPLVSRSNLGVRGHVELSDGETRARIADFAATLVQEFGFDGVHLDVETVWNDDQHFLELWEEVRAAIGPGKLLSVAGAHWSPPILGWLPVVGDLEWTTEYYQAVAMRADQILAMTYDSYMPAPALYRLWLREQERGLSRALHGSPAELLIGVSVSDERTASHRPEAENINSGLAGACAGIQGAGRAGATVKGIALYASWEATIDDWRGWNHWTRAE